MTDRPSFPVYYALKPPLTALPELTETAGQTHEFAVTKEKFTECLFSAEFRRTYHLREYGLNPRALTLSCYEYLCLLEPKELFGLPVLVVQNGVVLSKEQVLAVFSKEYLKNNT